MARNFVDLKKSLYIYESEEAKNRTMRNRWWVAPELNYGRQESVSPASDPYGRQQSVAPASDPYGRQQNMSDPYGRQQSTTQYGRQQSSSYAQQPGYGAAASYPPPPASSYGSSSSSIQIFQQADSDQSGTIDAAELGRLLSEGRVVNKVLYL
jgi:hypothetical protein